MTISELLSGRFGCECGRDHACPIKYLKIGGGAIGYLSVSTAEYEKILLVSDGNTYAAAGEAVERAIGDRIVGRVDFGKELLIPDEAAIAKIEAAVGEDTGLIVGIGSGVINDLCKYVSHKMGIRYQIVATAPSMDGYASVGAALILEGMKVTLSAEVPEAIIADTDVLCRAPMDMIVAGFGDIMGKYSCLCDWKLAKAVRGEYFCDFVYGATMETVERTRAVAEGIARRDPEAVGVLAEALITVGILMAYVGTSRPASGAEHHFSHYFEIVGILRGEAYLAHGTDVFYSTALTAKMREKLINEVDFRNTPPTIDEKTRVAEIRRVYGRIADGVIALGDKVGLHAECEKRISIYRERWDEIKEILAEAPCYDEIVGLIGKVGLDIGELYKVYGEEKIRDAMLWAKELKDRYTALWAYTDLFGYNS